MKFLLVLNFFLLISFPILTKSKITEENENKFFSELFSKARNHLKIPSINFSEYFDWNDYEKLEDENIIANEVNENIKKILDKRDPYERKLFFIIDSRSLESVKTNFYGYSYSDHYLLENSNYNKSITLNKLGCYVAVNRYKRKITLEQDLLGSFGLHLFKHNDIFIISNSFKILVEYLKTQFKITLNEDNMYYFLSSSFNLPYTTTTLINEITYLDRETFITIDIPSKKLELYYIDNQEFTIPVNSKQGIEVLDKWLEKWINIFRFIYSQTDNISTDLTAGFDTRAVFAIWLNSGIDLNRIYISSHKKNAFPYGLDFQVASKITSLYNLTINNKSHIDKSNITLSLEEGIQNSDNLLMGFHKQFFYKNWFFLKKRFRVSGLGGEMLRDTGKTLAYVLDTEFTNSKYFNTSLAKKINKSVSIIQNKTLIKFFEVNENYKDLKIFTKKYFRFVFWRPQFGRQTLENYLSNTIYLNPLIDPDLYRLTLTSDEVDDNYLLISLIFTRYKDELLKLKFNNKYEISNKTLEFSRKINSLYPFDITKLNLKSFTKSNISNSIFKEDTIIPIRNGTKNTPNFDNYINEMITTKPYKDLIKKFFGDDYYEYILNNRKKNAFPINSNQTVYEIINIALDVKENHEKYKFE